MPSDNPPFLATEVEGCKGVDCVRTGAYVGFIREVLEEAGLNWTFVEISSVSRAFSPRSSYTACVYEVSIGGADLCLGNFW